MQPAPSRTRHTHAQELARLRGERRRAAEGHRLVQTGGVRHRSTRLDDRALSAAPGDEVVGDLGDNRNALALTDALADRSLNGGTASLSDVFGRLVADVGVHTRQAQLSRDALELVQGDARSAIESVSGVNLDEEAANLVRLQQAYQAAAQVVRVADSLFDTLLGAIGR